MRDYHVLPGGATNQPQSVVSDNLHSTLRQCLDNRINSPGMAAHSHAADTVRSLSE